MLAAEDIYTFVAVDESWMALINAFIMKITRKKTQ
jgi:hypothetical protein